MWDFAGWMIPVTYVAGDKQTPFRYTTSSNRLNNGGIVYLKRQRIYAIFIPETANFKTAKNDKAREIVFKLFCCFRRDETIAIFFYLITTSSTVNKRLINKNGN